MATPNIATITASLVRSFQNCSLNHQHSGGSSSCNSGGGGAGEAARGADSPENPLLDSDTPTLELNSQAALPYYWEQCLDLKTGEIYYINWRTGMKSKEDPRTTVAYGGDYYSEDDINSSYDSEESSTESSPRSSSREQWSGNSNTNNQENCCSEDQKSGNEKSGVLVVAGCKGCFMYYMVPKQNEVCPKCCGQLIHFDRSENGCH